MNYTLVGLFVLLLGAALIGVVLWLTVGGIGGYATYVAYFEESVAGLNPQAAVRYLGVEVGQVRAITLEPTPSGRRVRLLLDIREDVPLDTATVATLRSQGVVTGLVYVELSGGGRAAPPLRAGTGTPYPEIPTRRSTMGRIEELLPTLAEDVAAIAANLREVSGELAGVFSEENRAALANTLQALERASAALAAGTEGLEGPLGQAEAMLREATRAARSIRNLSEAAGRTLASVEEGSLVDLDQLVGGMRRLVETLQRLAQELQRDPNILLFGRGGRVPGPGESR